MTGSLPFIVVPHPFFIGEYRVTPCCIIAATALFTVIAIDELVFLRAVPPVPSHLFPSYALLRLWDLVMGLHLVLRNDRIKSRVKNVKERLKEKLHDCSCL